MKENLNLESVLMLNNDVIPIILNNLSDKYGKILLNLTSSRGIIYVWQEQTGNG